MATKTVGATPTTTYSYLAETEVVARLDDGGAGNPDVSSVLAADGSRLLARQTSPTVATGFLLPDLHGNTAAAMDITGTITSALRYDAFGQVIGVPYTGAGAPSMPWRFGGRMDVASGTGAQTLYDMSARNYSPVLAPSPASTRSWARPKTPAR
jgi:hypothetical protein